MDLRRFDESNGMIDLESGTNGLERTGREGFDSNRSNGWRPKKLLSRARSGFKSIDRVLSGEPMSSGKNSLSSSHAPPTENGGMVVDKRASREEKVGADKLKNKASKKPPKPPRPPMSPPLDAADQKFIQKMSELAMLKRLRIERMKALKKTENGKGASSNSNLYAMVVTVLFCFVILWQGLFSRGSPSLSSESPPATSARAREGFIPDQYQRDISSNGPHDSSLVSSSNVERMSQLGGQGDPNRLAGQEVLKRKAIKRARVP